MVRRGGITIFYELKISADLSKPLILAFPLKSRINELFLIFDTGTTVSYTPTPWTNNICVNLVTFYEHLLKIIKNNNNSTYIMLFHSEKEF